MTWNAIGSVGLQQAALVIASANAVGFSLSAAFRTHILTDLVGVGSFVLTTLRLSALQKDGQLTSVPWWDNRLLLVNALVGVWGVRLASYLFHRINYIKEDKRLAKFYPGPGEGFLDAARSNFPLRLGSFWSIQALWGFLTMLPVTLLNSAALNAGSAADGGRPLISISESATQLLKALPAAVAAAVPAEALRLGGRALVSAPFVSLAAGIAIETLADYQKYQFKSDARNADRWCDVGLWKYSRFPNYFGEMLVWWSAWAAVAPAFVSAAVAEPAALGAAEAAGVVAATVLSPLFITGLLLGLSGVPIHDRNNRKRFGQDPRYQRYLRDTPTIVPFTGGQQTSKPSAD
eukprot:gene12479-8919_t